MWIGVVGVRVRVGVVLGLCFACVGMEPRGQGKRSQFRILWIRLDVVACNALRTSSH